MIGDKLGHYEVTAKIGKGGMGVVYRATDTLIGRDVALKTIHLHEIEDPTERQFLKDRLFREAKSAGILSHPNIVTVYQIGDQDGLTYIAMEFVDGLNLGELLGRTPRPTLEALLSVFDQTAGALDYAHSRGVVHRDIKPGNIIVRADGVAKIADFGVAKISSQNVTRAGMALGTPHYMSPEQFHGRAIDGRSDQYALAVMIYEIFTGKKPFTADSIHGLMYKILHEEAQPRRDNPEISEGVDAALRKALAKEPDQRFITCSDFIAELRNVCGIMAMPFSIESGLRQSTGAPSGGLRTQGTTPLPSPVSTPIYSAGAPGAAAQGSSATGATARSGVGLPPPPAPPAPPAPEAAKPEGKRPTSVPPATAATPTPVAGSAASSAASASGAGLPPPPPQSGAKPSASKAPAPTKAKATPPKEPVPASAAKAPAGTPSKTPLVLVAVVGVVLLVAAGIAAYLLLRPSVPPTEETQQIAQPSQPSETTPVSTPQPEESAPETTAGGGEPTPAETPTTPQTATAAPEISSFVAEPIQIEQGQSAKLRWSTTNTSYVQINPGLSRGRGVGEFTVTPAQTTKYTLVARGLGGRLQKEVTITVTPKEAKPQQGGGSTKPGAWTLDALTRALEAGEDVVKMDSLMVRVGLNGVTFPVTPEAQSAILAAGDRGKRPKDSVVRLLDLARQGGRR